MSYIGKTLVLLGTVMVLTGCGSGSTDIAEEPEMPELPETPEVPETPETPNLPPLEKPEFEVPTVYSLSAFAEGFPIGVAVSEWNIRNESISNIVIQHFTQVTAENIMKPEVLQPSEDSFDFEKSNELVNFAQTNGISIHGHTLVWHNQSPAWMQGCNDVLDCTNTMNNHITKVVQHFAGEVDSWDVVNEAFLQDGSYRGSADTNDGIAWVEKIGKDYISKAFITARAADTSAELYYNDYNLAFNDAKIDAVITLVEDMKAAETPIDGIAFQMHVTDTYPTIENISAAFQKAVDTGLKVKLSELDVRMNLSGEATALTEVIATAQKNRYAEIIEAYLAVVPKKQRGGISVWGVSDQDSWLSTNENNHPDWPLMFDGDLNQKPAILGFADAMLNEPEAPAEPLGPFEGYADDFSDEGHFAEKDGERYLAYNPVEQTVDFQINWSLFDASSEYNVTRTFDKPLDINRGVSLVFKVKIPETNLTDGNVIIQPFLDSASGPAFIRYVQGQDFTSTLDDDGWSTITIENLGPDFDFGYIGNFDFDAVTKLGLQFKFSGDTPPVTGIIQLTEVSIIDPNADENEVSETEYAFNDDFIVDSGMYEKDLALAFISHNPTDESYDFTIDWTSFDAEGSYQVALPFAANVDISAGVTLEIKAKIPSDYVNSGNVIIQPFLESDGYKPAYIQYLSGADFSLNVDADGWSTITIEDIKADFNFGYVSSSFDETNVISAGLQFKWKNEVPTTETIQVGRISLIN
ncbi:hypothetical protein GCM10007916_13970 [Psychromonas marina]|uniref:Beta-xylanase n=1 Tax=Psychromonas marina TaxID=88364 RepID=A0ABQ6DZG1_9GAMM|nr:endo-1,4-beta-xylanase [Psychromonas marina]GLS90330.1 hypothetical protein GCM10007916_13970 [Psychromonas marina]